jgi:hypothetical protein
MVTDFVAFAVMLLEETRTSKEATLALVMVPLLVSLVAMYHWRSANVWVFLELAVAVLYEVTFMEDFIETCFGTGKFSLTAGRQPVIKELFPFGQVLHLTEPKASLYFLSLWSHAMHAGVPWTGACLPASQLWHVTLALYELFPRGHSLHFSEGGISPFVPLLHSSILEPGTMRHPGATETVEAPPCPTMDPRGGKRHSVPF